MTKRNKAAKAKAEKSVQDVGDKAPRLEISMAAKSRSRNGGVCFDIVYPQTKGQ